MLRGRKSRAVITSAIGWLVIVFGVVWLLSKLFRGSTRDKRDPEAGESHGQFRK
jgi:thiosulfate reductase cytochrome b subunit